MRQALRSIGILCILSCFTACAPSAPATQPQSESVQQLPSQAELMAKWQDYATPGEAHAKLEPLVGKWNTTTRWWQDSAAPPQEAKGTSEIRWILGNRFLEHTVEGEMMGMPYQALGIIGFDKAAGEYRMIWLDTMGTGMMEGSASFDSGTNALVEHGDVSCPLTRTQPYRAVTTLVDPRHFRYELFLTPPGTASEMKVMEIEYTKSKKG